jgi:LacI family transcriptional regulator
MPAKSKREIIDRPTLRDVGKLAGVDPSLVSRVLNNNSTTSASLATKKKILAAVKTLDYKVNFSARGLKMARSSTIGILLPNLRNPIYEEMVRKIQGQAMELGYGVILGSHAEIGSDKTFASLLVQGQVDGIIVLGLEINDASLQRLAENDDGRVLIVNARLPGISSSVVLEDSLGAEYCVNHLNELGHKKIVGIFSPLKSYTYKRRYTGYKKECDKLGIEPLIVIAKGFEYHDGYIATLEAIAKYKPTAIFAASNFLATGVLRALRECNLAVPEQVSIISIHDSVIAEYLSPPLTIFSLPILELATTAIEQLVGMIAGESPKHTIVKGKPILVLRSSTTAPPISVRLS